MMRESVPPDLGRRGQADVDPTSGRIGLAGQQCRKAAMSNAIMVVAARSQQRGHYTE